MTNRREHVLVLAETTAAENGFRGELDTGVARELGVDVEAYRHYRQVCAAIDQYELQHRGHELLASSAPEPTTELETVEDLIERALDLHRSWRGATGWHPDEISTHARRILATALTLKGQIERQSQQLERERFPDRELDLEL